jgi:hypothetical protein
MPSILVVDGYSVGLCSSVFLGWRRRLVVVVVVVIGLAFLGRSWFGETEFDLWGKDYA